jgi:hypothetical protein
MLMIGIERGRHPLRSVMRRTTVSFLAATLAATLLVTASWSQEAPRGQAVVLNENTDTQGERHPGSVAWRIDRITVAGQPDELAIHGDAEVPEMRMKITIDIRRNSDKSLPASHVVQVTFALPPDVAGGKVIAAPGLLMKFSESARGTPLSSASVKITDGSFLFGLSGRDADRERNLQLLKERAWFDVPMVYANQHRGIFVAEKGFHGEDVFNEAMTAWEKSP